MLTICLSTTGTVLLDKAPPRKPPMPDAILSHPVRETLANPPAQFEAIKKITADVLCACASALQALYQVWNLNPCSTGIPHQLRIWIWVRTP